jgi:hypothetical protein
MIELTSQQLDELDRSEDSPPQVLNPRTQERFVLVRTDDYAKLKETDYDDSPWTREEMAAMAWHVGRSHGWEEDTDYDHIPDKS